MGRATCFDGGGHAKVASHVPYLLNVNSVRGLLMFVFFLSLFLTKLVAGQSCSKSIESCVRIY